MWISCAGRAGWAIGPPGACGPSVQDPRAELTGAHGLDALGSRVECTGAGAGGPCGVHQLTAWVRCAEACVGGPHGGAGRVSASRSRGARAKQADRAP